MSAAVGRFFPARGHPLPHARRDVLEDLRARVGRRAVGEEENVVLALVHDLERGHGLDDDDRARAELVALLLLAEEHRQSALEDDEDLLLYELDMAPAR